MKQTITLRTVTGEAIAEAEAFVYGAYAVHKAREGDGRSLLNWIISTTETGYAVRRFRTKAAAVSAAKKLAADFPEVAKLSMKKRGKMFIPVWDGDEAEGAKKHAELGGLLTAILDSVA